MPADEKMCVLIWDWQMMSWAHGYSHRYPSNWSRLDIFNLSIQKICFFKSFTSPVFYLDDVLNKIPFRVAEQDNQTCFLSWICTLPHAEIIYSAWLVLKQGWVSTTLFLGRNHVDVPEIVSSQLVTQWSTRTSPEFRLCHSHLPRPPRTENTFTSLARVKLSRSTLLAALKMSALNFFRYNICNQQPLPWLRNANIQHKVI